MDVLSAGPLGNVVSGAIRPLTTFQTSVEICRRGIDVSLFPTRIFTIILASTNLGMVSGILMPSNNVFLIASDYQFMDNGQTISLTSASVDNARIIKGFVFGP